MNNIISLLPKGKEVETHMDYASRNSNMRGDYPRLKSGSNIVGWSGSVSRIVITPNWRSV